MPESPLPPVSVLFVCLGNICRSPTAHGVFASMVEQAGLSDVIHVDSAGTGGWHIGSAPDARACKAAAARGYDLSAQRARQLEAADFERFDLILVMDRQNLISLERFSHNHCGRSAPPQLFLEQFGRQFPDHEVPDPYYGDADGFDHVLDLVEDASRNLLSFLQKTRLS
jgi:protein-tyrosine phosphatase